MSQHNPHPGTLYLVATPIGNLEDMTLRAIRTLKEVSVIAAEDTRRARILCNHFEINTRLISYHAHNEHKKTESLLEMLRNGDSVAVISDAGTPAIADPGFLIVREALKQQIEPVIIPGVSALSFAVTAAGLPVDKFSFFGFLPPKPGKRTKLLEVIAAEDKTAVVFVSPHKIAKTLLEIRDALGPHTQVAVVREATKLHEEILRGTIEVICEQTANRNWKGECVLVIHPCEESPV